MSEMASRDRLRKLRRAVDYSIQRMRVFREKRKSALDQYVGSNYSEEGSADRVPLNFMEMAASVYQRLLVSSSPRVTVLVDDPLLKPVAADLELTVNHLLDGMRFKNELSSVALEALFGLGVMKVGIAPTRGPYSPDDTGQVFASSVSFEDFVFDVLATRWEDVSYMGDLYRVPLRDILDNPRMDSSVRDKLRSSERSNMAGSETDQRAETLGTGPKRFDEAYERSVELWDMWCPRDRTVVTYPAEEGMDALWERDFVGPERGMYHDLRFSEVPKNIMPLPPAALWMDLHELANRLFRKLARQAERQKTVLAVQSANAEDGARFVDAADGEAIPMMDPTSAKEITTGRPDPANNQFLMQLRSLFNIVSGNVEMLGGIAAATETVGQDSLLNKNASERVKAMQDAMVELTTNVTSDIAWYVWEDPFVDVTLSRRVPGTTIDVPVRFNHGAKRGDYFNYNFSVIPHSLRMPTPRERLAGINQLLTQVAMPLMPLLQQRGIGINFEEYFRLASKYMAIPELADLLTFAAPMSGPDRRSMPSPLSGSGGPPRRYIRENVSHGPTAEARDNQIAMMMAAADRRPLED